MKLSMLLLGLVTVFLTGCSSTIGYVERTTVWYDVGPVEYYHYRPPGYILYMPGQHYRPPPCIVVTPNGRPPHRPEMKDVYPGPHGPVQRPPSAYIPRAQRTERIPIIPPKH